jgi:hypothetical protein
MHIDSWQDWAAITCAILIVIILAVAAISAALHSATKQSDDEWARNAQRHWQDNADVAAVMLQQEAAQNREQAALIISLADAQRAKRGVR